MADWPSNLPEKFDAGTYQESPMMGNNVIVQDMEYGPPKRRVRSTAAKVQISGSMLLLEDDYTTYFKPFFNSTIGYGVLPFNLPHPYDGLPSTISVYFDVNSPYSVTDTSIPGYVSLTMNLFSYDIL